MRTKLRRVLLGLSAILATVTGTLAITSQPAHAAILPSILINRQWSGCLAANTSQRTAWVATCSGGTDQKWYLQSAGGAYYFIRPYNDPSLCLDVQWGSPNDGTPIWLWPCNYGYAQIWRQTSVDGSWSWYQTQTASNKCLDKDFWNNIDQWACHAGSNAWWQQWLRQDTPGYGLV